MGDRRVKRRSIEKGHLDFWLRRGKGSYHLENIAQIESILRATMRFTGLLNRGLANSLDVRLRELEFAFPTLPTRFDGFTLLQLSDLHLEGVAGLAERLVEVICPRSVDLCVMTGDYRFAISGGCDLVQKEMAKLLPAVRSRHGIVGILGNHDFLEQAEGLERMGVRMLVNAAFELREGDSSIWIIGLDDPHYYGCDDLPTALRGVPADAFKILLVHSPEMATEAAAAGFHLYLCGHTHGGQIRFPLIGPLIRNAKCPREYISGAWRCGSLQGYTSAGAGASLLPVRFGCPPEVTLITLRKAPSAPSI
jgi:predicted MPP superfamily phosphohydrolase